MQLEEAAQGFAAVGSEPRLEVLLALVKAGHQGLSIGTIGERLGIPLSTLAHHLISGNSRPDKPEKKGEISDQFGQL